MNFIQSILTCTTDSFGTKTVVYKATDGKIYVQSADEGSHSGLETGNRAHGTEVLPVNGMIDISFIHKQERERA